MANRKDWRSAEAQQYRGLYSTTRWRAIRAAQLRNEPICRMCMKSAGLVTPATVCDHIDPNSKKTEAGFFAGPFQSLCAPHHNSTKAREEARGYVVGCDAHGRPLDVLHPWNLGRTNAD